MDAISHRETREQMRLFNAKAQLRGYKQAIAKALPPNLKRQAMDAISGVETVAQIGVLKATGGIAVYVARIREADRENKREKTPKHPEKTYYGRSQGFLRD